jgi:uncharacterized protein (DUF169 family)
MNGLTEELDRLCQSDPDVATVFNTFAEIERIYAAAAQAMGLGGKSLSEAGSAVEVTVTFRPSSSSSSA